MKLLLDTHAFLFALGEPALLTARTRKMLLDPEIERWVSAVSLWEIAIKIQIGKLGMPSDGQFYVKGLDDLQARVLPVEARHSLAIFDMPLHHRDTFDRLLIAQARADGLTLISRDQAFSAYDVQTMW